MNILREEFCKEKNVPIGLDNVYDYCTWLEKKLTETKQALQLHKTNVSGSFYCFNENRREDVKKCIVQCSCCKPNNI